MCCGLWKVFLLQPSVYISRHAGRRMSQRSIRIEQICLTVRHGRRVYSPGVLVFVIGRKEVQRHRNRVDLRSIEGFHVLIGEDCVVTAYRNNDLQLKRLRKNRWNFRSQKGRRNRQDLQDLMVLPELGRILQQRMDGLSACQGIS